MASLSRSKRPGPIPAIKRILLEDPSLDTPVPDHFRCPISLDLMRDPVTASTGITYDRQSIESWLERGNLNCPVTGKPIDIHELIPNHSTRKLIQEWCVQNRALGVERIPTPRIPISPLEASEILSQVSLASRRGDKYKCGNLAMKLKEIGKESERDRRCIAAAGAARVLSAAFSQLAGESSENSKALGDLEKILSALAVFFPLDIEAKRWIISPGSLKSMVLILKYGDLSGRLSTLLVLREVVSTLDNASLESVSKTNGLAEALTLLVEKPISPLATKTSLVTIFYLISSNERAASRFVNLGLVSLLLDTLVDSDKSMCEKALAVLEGLFQCEKGREKGCEHALTVPVLVKKMLRVSDMATEFSVSALWRICKGCKKNCIVEAVQVGAFQKLLLLLQVGCNGVTKERASELLKILNGSRGSVECIETVDFKGLKRSFD
ncbi:U-box domain-containing protein 21 [Rhynchospora pubera]|uniref:U-box domain-containing protein n=1 Tax=Rhynchospora pubera TaxID=906938 RepID=A0AAV8D6E4_9POAL|nr:U-box domain-containing protein 21 [Rhynchospora pubera]